MRPVLKPALRRLRRGDAAVQLGLAPHRRLLLEGLDAADEELLAALDGTRTSEEVAAGGAHAVALLTLLARAEALDDAAADRSPLAGLPRAERERLAPDLAQWSLALPGPASPLEVLRARQAASVHVHGTGRLPAALATLLAAAGVGRVATVGEARAHASDAVPGGLTPGDAGVPTAAAAAAAVQRAAPSTSADPPRIGEVPRLVVLCGRTPVAPRTAALEGLARASVPHLSVRVEDARAVVGPLVLPGATPCLRCADLERRDRDPAWPRIAAELAGAEHGGPPSVPPPGDVVLVSACAALAAGQALAWLDADVAVDGTPLERRRDRAGAAGPLPSPLGPPAAVGATLELALPGWQWRRRTWPAHPACGCGAARPTPASAPQAADPGDPPVGPPPDGSGPHGNGRAVAQ